MDSFASSFSPPRPSILNNTSLKSLSLPIMVLEATMLVLDNSEYMRNGDYLPTRWEAQSDAVNIVFNAKTNSNPENNVGVMTMASKTPKVLVTLTQDIGKILSALHDSTIEGNSNVATGINIAQLALKHRQNKLQRQRIILFVGSPIADDEASLVALGKKLKKNSVAIDIVSFGEDEQNEDKLAKFVEAANSGENCHLLTIPAGAQLLSDVILSSPILQEEGDGAGPSGSGSGGGGGGGFEFGVDPSMDPELAMALRMSLEEEQARQRTAEGASGSGEALPSVAEGSEPASASNTTSTSSAIPATPKPALAGSGSMVMQGAEPIAGVGAAADDDSEDAELQRALALSAGVGGDGDVEMASADTAATAGEAPRATVAGDDGEDEEMSEEEAIARAIEMSLKENDEN